MLHVSLLSLSLVLPHLTMRSMLHVDLRKTHVAVSNLGGKNPRIRDFQA